MPLAVVGVLLVLLGFDLGSAGKARAEGPVPLSIAILDVERVLRSAEAVKDIRAKLRKSMDAYRTETQREEEEIRKAQQELAEKLSVLSAEDYETARRRLEQRLAAAQVKVQQRRRSLDQAQTQAMGEVQNALNGIVAEIANERDLTLILRKEQAVLVATQLEITDEVLRRLDSRLPSVEVAAPPGGEPAE
jgi:Skp family chaperone for outer membrane proteins